MKIAILHEMLVKLGGAEKVLEKFVDIFPEADLYTLIYDENKVGKIFPKEKVKNAKSTQRIYNITKNQRFCLPFMSKAVESLDFSSYDIVLCSSSGFAHGAITKPETKFIVYYHSPARYLWDWTNEYKKDIGWNSGIKGCLLNKIFLNLRKWDYIASKRCDVSLANSKNSALRVKKYYKKESEILYPPIETKRFQKNLPKNRIRGKILEGKFLSIKGEKLDYYIIISALTEFKKIEIAIEGFNKIPENNLVIIGEGNYRNILESKVKGNNILFTGAMYGDDLVELVQDSLGLIFPGEEDFGIVPIEAMAAGKPIFAYRGGGLLETVLEDKTGNFFNDKTGYDFISKFREFDKKVKNNYFCETFIKEHAFKFDESNFEKRIKEIVANK